MRRGHEMAASNEQSLERSASVQMIIDQQDSQRPAFGHWSGQFHDARRRRHGFHCQNESGSAVPAFATRDERAAVSLGKRFGNGQAETESAITPLKRALALFERIENTIHDF